MANKVSGTASAASGAPEKIWLKSYHPSIPHILPPLAHQSIPELLLDCCKKYAAKPAFVLMGKSISYADVERESGAFGAYLQSMGLQKGARVAVMMPNILQYPVAVLGILRAGGTVVNVNPLYTPRELEH